MGTIILIIALIIELIFAVYCIRLKSNQKKIRSAICIIAFGVFVIFTSVSIIEWSFRWWAIAALLLIWAVLGAITLIKNKADKKEYKTFRIIRKAIISMVVIILVLSPALIFPQYKELEVTGTSLVETASYTYVDDSRLETYTSKGENRKLNVQFWYPDDTNLIESSVYPLVVFSHGGTGIKSSNESLYRELASHGYVVCSIDHTYQSLYTKDENGKITFISMEFMNDISEEDASENREKSYHSYKKWMEIRTSDIDFVIDTIIANSNDSTTEERLYQLVDTTKIGVLGHSLGGSAALGIGRSRDDVSAVIALESPFLCDIEGVENGEFVFNSDPYPIPVLHIYSDSSWEHLDEWPQYAKNAELLSDTEEIVYNVYMQGTGHFSLTDLSLTSPFFTRIFNAQETTMDAEYCLEKINKICLEFFDCYLKGETEFVSEGIVVFNN